MNSVCTRRTRVSLKLTARVHEHILIYNFSYLFISVLKLRIGIEVFHNN